MPYTTKEFDGNDLQRFVDAQDSTFEQARLELVAGEKRSHWMWFVFPQVQGLGSSAMAQRFAIRSLEEGAAYLNHPLLGTRLRDCTALVNAVENRPIHEIFGYPDDQKFHSSVTLFNLVSEKFHFDSQVFAHALAKYYSGRMDQGTLDQLHIF